MLADPLLSDKTLPVERLEAIDTDLDTLRSARQIGCLTAKAFDDRETLRKELIE